MYGAAMKLRGKQIWNDKSKVVSEVAAESPVDPDAASDCKSDKSNTPSEHEKETLRRSGEATFSVPRFSRKMRSRHHEIILSTLNGNDIRYRGPLSYRHLKIIAWVMCAIAVCGSILLSAYKLIPHLLPIVYTVGLRLSSLSSFALPLFMLANFAVILNAKDGYRRLLIAYAVSVVLMYLGFLFVVCHYVFGIFEMLYDSRQLGMKSSITLICAITGKGYVAFNIFVDLLLCTLLNFFLSYQPKRIFKGKWHIMFRWFAVFPILYELASIAVKMLSGLGKIVLPFYLWPLLTTKPPVLFFIFLVIAIFIKRRERKFRKSGFSHVEYVHYLKTNRNSLQFSIHVFIIFVLGTVIDMLAFSVLPAILATTFKIFETKEQALHLYQITSDVGFGQGIVLFMISPIVLLFSYTKTYKNRIVDKLIPVGGVVLVLIFSIELIYQMIRMIPNL